MTNILCYIQLAAILVIIAVLQWYAWWIIMPISLAIILIGIIQSKEDTYHN